MALHESEEWEEDDIKDDEKKWELEWEGDEGYWNDELSSKLKGKKWMDDEELHDLKIVKEGRYTQLEGYVQETQEDKKTIIKKNHQMCFYMLTIWELERVH